MISEFQNYSLSLVVCEGDTMTGDFEVNNSLLWFLAPIKRLLVAFATAWGPVRDSVSTELRYRTLQAEEKKTNGDIKYAGKEKYIIIQNIFKNR